MAYQNKNPRFGWPSKFNNCTMVNYPPSIDLYTPNKEISTLTPFGSTMMLNNAVMTSEYGSDGGIQAPMARDDSGLFESGKMNGNMMFYLALIIGGYILLKKSNRR